MCLNNMKYFFEEHILYFDNHLVVAFKPANLLSQKDETGDESILEMVKRFIKEKMDKPGDVFLGSVHRLDRPAMGLMVFAKTSKALARLNEMMQQGGFRKTYLCVTEGIPAEYKGTLKHYLQKDPVRNKVKLHKDPGKDRKEAILSYELIGRHGKFSLFRIHLETGRPHQIRAQMASIGCPIVGDLKYGSDQNTPDKSICLLSWKISFIHPVTKENLRFQAKYPASKPVWKLFENPG